MNLVIVQRVITPYRLELLNKLSPYFNSIKILTSAGEESGAAKAADSDEVSENVSVVRLRSIKLAYSGEARSWAMFFYPQSLRHIIGADVLLLEGLTNYINNIYLVPFAKILRKKMVWWDAGYSPSCRSNRRKVIDKFASFLIKMTDRQVAYSSAAKQYMETYMGARRCFLILNTISTSYFDKIEHEIRQSERERGFLATKNEIHLLYVGAVEQRKRVRDLIQTVDKLNRRERTKFILTVIGDGNDMQACKEIVSSCDIEGIEFIGRVYDKDELKKYYFRSDLFVMPGDGGLGIAQSLLFGLPAVCIAADGTERDYIDDSRYILNKYDELPDFLSKFRHMQSNLAMPLLRQKLHDSKFISSMTHVLKF